MSKFEDQVKDLQGRLVLLARLDAPALALSDGVFLLRAGRVRDPRRLVAACRAGLPALAAVAESVELTATPIPVTPRLLSRAHRDLRVLESAPELRNVAGDVRRLFSRYGELDAAFIAARRERLASLSALVAGEGRAPDRSEWFDRVLDLVRHLYGDRAARSLGAASREAIAHGGRARARARGKLEQLVTCLSGQMTPGTGPEVPIAARRIAALHPGRTFERRAIALLRELLDLPAAPPGPADARRLADPHTTARPRASASARGPASPRAPADPQGPARSAGARGAREAAHPSAVPSSPERAAFVRDAGERLLAEIPSTRTAEYRDDLHETLALWGLAFDPGRGDPRALAATPAALAAARSAFPFALEHFGGSRLSPAEALELASVPVARLGLLSNLPALVEAGVDVATIRAIAELGHLEDLCDVADDPSSARAYAAWITRLAPHFRRMNVRLTIPAKLFATLRDERRDPGVLAVCLVERTRHPTKESVREAIAVLEATLGLFREVPGEAAAILDRLTAAPPGRGRAAEPELADWLEDDALLDRWAYLSELTGTPPALSRRLRRDFDHASRIRRERDHLAGLPDPTPEQRERLARLEREGAERADPAWTRRRLEEVVEELLAAAYRRELLEACRRLVAEAWSIPLAAITPAWLDAIRFFFATSDNQELLGGVLRLAAANPGRNIARLLPRNRDWLSRAEARFPTGAWLAPRSRVVSPAGKSAVLAFEDDPIEVLRMGIPFGTCLSILDGSNAASAVINAADANKRVAYLRDARGSVLARKLYAISADWRLIGYRLYSSSDDDVEHEVSAAFGAFAADLARDLGVPCSPEGEPEQLHPGFWYDDGTVPFEATGAEAPNAVAELCAHLGVAPPRRVPPAMRAEAELFAAERTGDVDRAIAAARDLHERFPASELLWILDRAAPPQRARFTGCLEHATMHAAERRGVIPLLEYASRVNRWPATDRVSEVLEDQEGGEDLAFTVVAAAVSASKRSAHFDHHGLEHQVVRLLPSLATKIPAARLFDLYDRASSLFAWIAEVSLGCRTCVTDGEERLVQAGLRAYRRDPEPEVVIECLTRGRRSALSHRTALEIAARFPLAPEAPRPSPVPGVPAGTVRSERVLAALARAAHLRAELRDSPEMFAALLRQSGGDLRAAAKLCRPSAAPFEAIGDLALALAGLDRALEPWCARTTAPAAGTWELHHHRRFRTPLRREAAAIAGRGGPVAEAALRTLANLGAVEELRELDPRRIRHLHTAELVRALIERIERGAPPVPQSERDPFDVALVSTAASYLSSVYAGPAAAEIDLAPLGAAYAIAGADGAHTGMLEVVFDLALRRDDPRLTAVEAGAFSTLLRSASVASIALRAWRRVELRDGLATALAERSGHRWARTIARIEAAGASASPPIALDGLFEGSFARVVELPDLDDAIHTDDAEQLRRMIRAAVTSRRWPSVVELYRELPTESLAAFLLRELAGVESASSDPELAALAAAPLRSWGPHPHRRGWLLACT